MQTIRFCGAMFFCVPHVGRSPSAMLRRMVSNFCAVVPSRGSLALVPDCEPPCAGVPMKMRVKFAGAAATVQSCEMTSGEDRGLHDAMASANARTVTDARMKGENFIHASLPNCVHGPGVRGPRRSRLWATQEAAISAMAAPAGCDFQALVAEGLLVYA